MTNSWTFPTIYAVLCGVLLAATAVAWALARGPQGTVLGGRELSTVELAMLNGGPRLAAVSNAAKLARHARPHDLTAVLQRATRSAPVLQAQAELTAAGLLLGARTATLLRVLWISAIVLASITVAGFGTLAVATGTDPLVLVVTAILGVTVAALVRPLGRYRWGASRRAMQLIGEAQSDRADEVRDRRAHLPLAIALFGSGVLWSVDPVFAAGLGLPCDLPTVLDELPASVGTFAGGCGGCGCG